MRMKVLSLLSTIAIATMQMISFTRINSVSNHIQQSIHLMKANKNINSVDIITLTHSWDSDEIQRQKEEKQKLMMMEMKSPDGQIITAYKILLKFRIGSLRSSLNRKLDRKWNRKLSEGTFYRKKIGMKLSILKSMYYFSGILHGVLDVFKLSNPIWFKLLMIF